MFYLYRKRDLDNRICECLLTSIAGMQAQDVRASFLLVGVPNGHQKECMFGFYGPRLFNCIRL